MTLKVEIRTVYGNDLIYPVCDDAKTFAQLMRAKTFTREQIKLITQLGYAFEIVNRNVDLGV